MVVMRSLLELLGGAGGANVRPSVTSSLYLQRLNIHDALTKGMELATATLMPTYFLHRQLPAKPVLHCLFPSQCRGDVQCQWSTSKVLPADICQADA